MIFQVTETYIKIAYKKYVTDKSIEVILEYLISLDEQHSMR